MARALREIISSRRTHDYPGWVEAYARNHYIPIEWAEKGVRKEDYLVPALRRRENRDALGVYLIFKSMELGRTFRISMPKFPTQDPNLPHPGAPAQPLHPLLFLHPGCSPGAHHPARGFLLPLPCHLLAQTATLSSSAN